MMKKVVLVALIVFNGNFFGQTANLKITFKPNTEHRFVFSNKNSAFWYGETQAANNRPFEGYTVAEQRYLTDYSLFRNGRPLERNSAKSILLWPDRLERIYSGFKETLFFIDGWSALVIKTESSKAEKVLLSPHYDGSLQIPKWKWNEKTGLAVARIKKVAPGRPEWTAVGAWSDDPQTRIEWQGGGASGSAGSIRTSGGKTSWFVIFIDSSRSEIREKFQLIGTAPEKILKHRRKRIQKLLSSAQVQTPDSTFNKAYAWALLSMDDLVTRQRGPGIWAGLPWFNNYWGRDSFISFRGALLASGQFDLAKEILLSFARFQNTNVNSPDFGRIPNRVRIKEIIYNSADGTPWFILACQQYMNYSGDAAFVEEIFPAARRAIEGALKFRVDSNGLLTHGDADTWMDAVGSGGPWSPRGNRALEIEALWMEQLIISSQWAMLMGNTHLAYIWQSLAENVRMNIRKMYYDASKTELYDHLNRNGQPDKRLRPNAVFALTVPKDPLFSQVEASALLQKMFARLVYPWGVATLPQDDPNFHPYHHYPPYYAPDAAYHNGLIWSWLNGAFITAAIKFDPEAAFALLQSEVRQILEDNAVGSLAELKETWPREGEARPHMSGAVSQAWSLAEFIRNVREDILGVHPDMEMGRINFEPHPPPGWNEVNFNLVLDREFLSAKYQFDKGKATLLLRGKDEKNPLTVTFTTYVDSVRVQLRTKWKTGKSLEIAFLKTAEGFTAKINGKENSHWKILPKISHLKLKFASPDRSIPVPALSAPPYALLKPGQVTRRPSKSALLLFDSRDPAGDDRGPEKKYTYPQNVNFQPGILDGRRAQIRKDRENYYFEIEYQNLVNPGWHPESGFQLTYTAITLHFSRPETNRRSRVGMNARYAVPSRYAYNFVIYVGNGLEIRDSRRKIVAKYVPRDVRQPLADLKAKRICFSIPVQYLSEAPLTNAAVLIGAQDDHGGGGIGEFREVEKTSGEWHGGGKSRGNNPNVYDIILLRH